MDSLLHPARSLPRPFAYPADTERFFPGDKFIGAHHSPTSNSEVKNTRDFIFTPTYAFMALYLKQLQLTKRHQNPLTENFGCYLRVRVSASKRTPEIYLKIGHGLFFLHSLPLSFTVILIYHSIMCAI
jgi:hypothetical protein